MKKPNSRSYEQFQAGIRATIERVGLQVIGVQGEGEPTFCYTIGVSEKYGFELICIGLPAQHATTMFNMIVLGYLAEGNTLELNVPTSRWSNFPCMFKECDDGLVRKYAVQAFEYYQKPLKMVQMVLSDRKGKLPGDPEFDHAHMDKFQPLLYRELH